MNFHVYIFSYFDKPYPFFTAPNMMHTWPPHTAQPYQDQHMVSVRSIA
jgi:hypothetical protein